MKKGIEKAKTLIESLPYIKEFFNKTIVIKYGGHAMGDKKLARKFAEDVVLLKQVLVILPLRSLERFGIPDIPK